MTIPDAAPTSQIGGDLPPSAPSDQPSDQPSDPPSDPSRRPAWLSWVVASVATAAVILGGLLFLSRGDEDPQSAVAGSGDDVAGGVEQPQAGSADPGAGFGSRTSGEVTAVDGDTLTVEAVDPDGSARTTTVVASSETVITETMEGTLADLAVGDDVVAMAEETDDGMALRSITEGESLRSGSEPPQGGGAPPQGMEPPGGGSAPAEGMEPPAGMEAPTEGESPSPQGGAVVAGEIVAVDATSVTIRTSDDESVVLSATEDSTVRLTETRSVSDIAVGDTITAMGSTDGDTVRATEIVIGDQTFGPGGPGGPPGSGAPAETGDPGAASGEES